MKNIPARKLIIDIEGKEKVKTLINSTDSELKKMSSKGCENPSN